ncbi:hypothetical protein [Streptomyces luteogriseus]|uniref:hypothetical protein n=1 Tax=Streptomyces luteogriseus TaxID=68233 RepID=UPI0036BB21C2
MEPRHHPVVASALDDGATDALDAVIAPAGLESGELEGLPHAESAPGQEGTAGMTRRTARAV